MSVQIALLAPATRVASRKLGPDRGQPLDPSPSRPAACATSRLASTCGRCDTHAIRRSWVVGVDRRRARAEAAEQPVQALVEHAGGAASGGRQVPGGAVEEVLAGVLDAGGLGARERMPADEALVGGGRGEHALGRADVAHHAVWAGGRRARCATVSASAPTGAATNTTSALGDRGGESSALLVDRPEGERAGAHVRVGVVAAHARAQRASRAASPIEPPISPTPRTAIRIRSGLRRLRSGALRARTDSANPSSTSTVVSQPMHPSVIDWP